ncbi:MAG: hypothetical protein EXR28_03900 [Betaproteobacteria bacterium]|nr:hypothetical protein [Betaproteobacteria bacterium]
MAGWSLDEPLDAEGIALSKWADQACATGACRKQIMEWQKLAQNRALAVRMSGTGVAWRFNADTPILALLGAVYACNHINGRPVQLCEGVAVNDFNLQNINHSMQSAHDQAFAEIRLPSEKYFAGEEFGGFSQTANAYRFQKMEDMTPATLEGIVKLGTQELAWRLREKSALKPIDVSGAFEGIPSAQKTSYTQLYWYRGGLESWKAAQLSLAPLPVRAVAR